MKNIDEKIEAIFERNKRVEADKAWETSLTRHAFLFLITYVTATFLLWSVNADWFFLQGLVPALAYLLSTWTLPPLKKLWIRKNRS